MLNFWGNGRNHIAGITYLYVYTELNALLMVRTNETSMRLWIDILPFIAIHQNIAIRLNATLKHSLNSTD